MRSRPLRDGSAPTTSCTDEPCRAGCPGCARGTVNARIEASAAPELPRQADLPPIERARNRLQPLPGEGARQVDADRGLGVAPDLLAAQVDGGVLWLALAGHQGHRAVLRLELERRLGPAPSSGAIRQSAEQALQRRRDARVRRVARRVLQLERVVSQVVELLLAGAVVGVEVAIGAHALVVERRILGI